MKKLTKEIKEFRKERAGYEFDLRVCQFIDKFKSKEEPTIELTFKEKIGVLSSIVTKGISRIK